MREAEVIVLGAGLAGLTASMIAAQHGLSVILVDQMGAAGQVLNVDRIENMPGFPDGVPGYELGPLILSQAEAAGCKFAFDTAVGLDVEGAQCTLRCETEDLVGRALIIAAGSSFKSLGIPGEERYDGRGVAHCASCDGPFFTDKRVAVIGGGDSAVEEAITLAQFADRVVVFNHGDELKAQFYLAQAAQSFDSVEIAHRQQVEEILGNAEGVTGVRVIDLNTSVARIEAVEGVFVYVGLQPNTSFLGNLIELDGSGHIATDVGLATSCPGVFAAGDIRQGSVSLAASAIGDGATAAVNAFRYLRQHGRR